MPALTYRRGGAVSQVGPVELAYREITSTSADGSALAKTEVGVVRTEVTQRDALGRVEVVKTTDDTNPLAPLTLAVLTLARDPMGRLVSRTLERPNGSPAEVTQHYGYDAHQRLAWVVEEEDSTLGLATCFGYDANGNRTSVSESPSAVSSLASPCSWTYDLTEWSEVDARDRLVSRTLDGTVSLVSTYDARGNRTELAEGPATTPFEPTDTTTSTWDVAGKLVGVELPSGLTVTYRYDVAGHLVYRRQEDGSSMVVTEDRFVYDGALLPQARVRYDAEGEVARVDRYVYTTSAHVPDAVVRCDDEACATPVVERVVTDHLGSAVGLVNASSGAWVAETRYDVWGVVIGSALPWDAVPFGFSP